MELKSSLVSYLVAVEPPELCLGRAGETGTVSRGASISSASSYMT
jgi:hypothetical protein